MFNIKEKQYLAKEVEKLIKGLNHPEMDNDNIHFTLHVDGKENWSRADIHENSRLVTNSPNLWNEVAREVMS